MITATRLPLVCLLSLLPSLTMALDARFVKQRLQLRQQRAELRAQACADRERRRENAEEIVAALLDVAAEHRVPGQAAILNQMCVGLRRLGSKRTEAFEGRIAALPAAPDAADYRERRAWEKAYDKQLRKLLTRTGDLLNRAIKAKLTDLAHEFLTEILCFDPDRAPLRTSLGQRKHEGRWLGPFEYAMARRGARWDPELAWILERERERYENGDYFDIQLKKWLPLEEANRVHGDLGAPWVIRTPHLEIRGTAPLAVLAEAGTRLEQFYAQIFAAYANAFTVDANDYELILGMADHDPLKVWIYRDKEQYHEALPNAPAWSAGLFSGRQRCSYFYGRVGETMYHEFTHQIFNIFSGGNRSEVWLTESIAVYTQSPTWNELGDLVLGERKRANRARSYLRAYAAKKHLPIQELLRISHHAWTNATDPGRNYDAAGALAQFCMEARKRSFRKDYVDYIRDAYRGRASHPLWEYLGMDGPAFIAAFEAWCEAGGKDPEPVSEAETEGS